MTIYLSEPDSDQDMAISYANKSDEINIVIGDENDIFSNTTITITESELMKIILSGIKK